MEIIGNSDSDSSFEKLIKKRGNEMKEKDSSSEEIKSNENKSNSFGEQKKIKEEVINTDSNRLKGKNSKKKVINTNSKSKGKDNKGIKIYPNRKENPNRQILEGLNLKLQVADNTVDFLCHKDTQTNLEHHKQPGFNYPQKRELLLTLPHLIEGRKSPFLMSEENSKIVANLLADHHPEKKGIFAYDAHFIFAVSVFIITAIIIAFILLINYNDLHLQKEEKKLDENKKEYLMSFQKGYRLDSYLFYIGVGFISVSIFVLSLLAVRNTIFSDSKKIEHS